MSKQVKSKTPLYIVLVSIHGLIRGKELELGRDADTGGQTKYVIELARALSMHPGVARVDLLTRRVIDDQVAADYGEPVEQLNDKARIVRLECGPAGYLRKEMLWNHLESFSDNVLAYLKSQHRMPDLIHSHYADAGYVGSRLAHQLGLPLVHTGHSLGHNKRKQLLAGGVKPADLEEVYHISRRIEAEETTLGVAECVITSTLQEIEQQYSLYDCYRPELMKVIPPGTDIEQFYPRRAGIKESRIAQELERFLSHPGKPVILALSRPDPKKNLVALVEAFGESRALREKANLVIVAGNRDDIQEMDGVARGVLNEILLTIDKYDLYGKVAFPKHHRPEEVATLYSIAAASKGVFVNPALTEPFGLTLLEAAACGLPLVATEDGGPVDILRACQNGYLVDPFDRAMLADRISRLLNDAEQWRIFSRNGIRNVRKHYSWQAHVERYLECVTPLTCRVRPQPASRELQRKSRYRDRAFFSSLDLNLVADRASLPTLMQELQRQHKSVIFGLATGRRLDDALATLRHYGIRQPDVLIVGQGSEIYYGAELTQDLAWERHINHQWNPQAVRELLSEQRGLTMQPKRFQGAYKISYFMDPRRVDLQEIRQLLLRNEQTVSTVFSFGQYLDILPVRASKGLALRWCANRLAFMLDQTLVAGVTGADADMLLGNTLGVVVDSRHLDELNGLSNVEKIFFSRNRGAAGILEAMEHYGFPDRLLASA